MFWELVGAWLHLTPSWMQESKRSPHLPSQTQVARAIAPTTLPTLLHLQNSLKTRSSIFFLILRIDEKFFEIESRDEKLSVASVASVAS